MFTIVFPCLEFNGFKRKCQELYDNSQETSHTRRLLVYAGLFCLCSEFSTLDEGEGAEFYSNLAGAFQRLLLQVLTNIPLIVPATSRYPCCEMVL